MDVAFRRAVDDARRQGGLPFAGLLSEDRILRAFGSARWFWQGPIYSPAVTLWVFLSQCLSADHSCVEAVARLIGWRLSRGLRPCSADTGAYCTARDKIPEAACRTLVRETGRHVEDEAPDDWLWLGRRVRCVDGTTLTMPDTPDNQAGYPQSTNQRPGCGFPIVRVVVVFSLAVGTVLNLALGQYQGKRTGENSLERKKERKKGTGPLLTGRGAAGIVGGIMPRTSRAAPDGMVYHVLNRGVGRQRLFDKPADYAAFEDILAE